MPATATATATAAALGALTAAYLLRAYLRRRSAGPSSAALALLKTVDSGALEAELARRSVGAHVINTSVRPRHAARADALDAELVRLGVAAPEDELAPGPPRKAYDTFARPRADEPCDGPYIARKAPLVAQQVAFLHRHELARRNALLRNVDDAEQALANARKSRHNVSVVLDNLRSAENVGSSSGHTHSALSTPCTSPRCTADLVHRTWHRWAPSSARRMRRAPRAS